MPVKGIQKQGVIFVLVSGIGWLLDFGIYTFLTTVWKYPVTIANILSSIPAITFVFIFSTRKIFARKLSCLEMGSKYVIYLVYQAFLLSVVSILAGCLYSNLYSVVMQAGVLKNWLPLIVKCLITPITMICNFIFMKVLVEKW